VSSWKNPKSQYEFQGRDMGATKRKQYLQGQKTENGVMYSGTFFQWEKLVQNKGPNITQNICWVQFKEDPAMHYIYQVQNLALLAKLVYGI
jgi:hypothetical protein